MVIIKLIFAIYLITWSLLILTKALDHSSNTTIHYHWYDNTTSHHHPPYVFLTIWTYLLLTVYLIYSTGCCFYYFFSRICQTVENTVQVSDNSQSMESEPDRTGLLNTSMIIENAEERQLPLYIQLDWLLFNTSSTSAVVVSVTFWSALWPMLQKDHISNIGLWNNINLHAINSIIVLIHFISSAIPVRLLHFCYPFAYGIIYTIFNIIYWSVDKGHNIVYPILNWNKPQISIPCILIIAGIVSPLVHVGFYFIYRLKLYIYTKLHGISFF